MIKQVGGSVFFLTIFFLRGLAQSELPFNWAYNLDQPACTLQLDAALNEISGLSMTADGRQLLAVQDEQGDLFFLDQQSGQIKQRINFWKEGD